MKDSISFSLTPGRRTCTSTGAPVSSQRMALSLLSRSRLPRRRRRFSSTAAKAAMSRSVGRIAPYRCVRAASSPARSALQSSYVMRSTVRMTLLAMVCPTSSPSAVRVMRQESVSRSTRGFSEQMPLDNSGGSMGTTRSAK